MDTPSGAMRLPPTRFHVLLLATQSPPLWAMSSVRAHDGRLTAESAARTAPGLAGAAEAVSIGRTSAVRVVVLAIDCSA